MIGGGRGGGDDDGMIETIYSRVHTWPDNKGPCKIAGLYNWLPRTQWQKVMVGSPFFGLPFAFCQQKEECVGQDFQAQL
jgi:hypothetical protein